MTTEALIHPEAQFQNSAPIGHQDSMPGGVWDIEISWDRNAGYMRAIIEGQRWHFKELLGRAVVVDTDNLKGRINIQAKAVLTGEQLVLYRPKDSEKHPWVKGLAYPATHNRLCYRRNPPDGQPSDWRLRDERETKKGNLGAIVFVKGYCGDLNVEWPTQDPVAHIYHNGPWTLCDPGCPAHQDGGYAHLYEEGV